MTRDQQHVCCTVARHTSPVRCAAGPSLPGGLAKPCCSLYSLSEAKPSGLRGPWVAPGASISVRFWLQLRELRPNAAPPLYRRPLPSPARPRMKPKSACAPRCAKQGAAGEASSDDGSAIQAVWDSADDDGGGGSPGCGRGSAAAGGGGGGAVGRFYVADSRSYAEQFNDLKAAGDASVLDRPHPRPSLKALAADPSAARVPGSAVYAASVARPLGIQPRNMTAEQVGAPGAAPRGRRPGRLTRPPVRSLLMRPAPAAGWPRPPRPRSFNRDPARTPVALLILPSITAAVLRWADPEAPGLHLFLAPPWVHLVARHAAVGEWPSWGGAGPGPRSGTPTCSLYVAPRMAGAWHEGRARSRLMSRGPESQHPCPSMATAGRLAHIHMDSARNRPGHIRGDERLRCQHDVPSSAVAPLVQSAAGARVPAGLLRSARDAGEGARHGRTRAAASQSLWRAARRPHAQLAAARLA